MDNEGCDQETDANGDPVPGTVHHRLVLNVLSYQDQNLIQDKNLLLAIN